METQIERTKRLKRENFQKHKHPCLNCGKLVSAKSQFCSSCARELEHVLIWEEAHGKPLPEGWIIHHLNGIPDDNRLVNLQALPNKKHYLLLQAKAKRIQELEALLNNQHQLL